MRNILFSNKQKKRVNKAESKADSATESDRRIKWHEQKAVQMCLEEEVNPGMSPA